MPAKEGRKGGGGGGVVGGVRGRGRYVPSYLSGGGESCAVCGDAASGLHYRAMTCEGCKGFFRRSVQKGLVYACKGAAHGNADHCPLSPLTRNHCASCRYRKALAVGMAKDLVLSEEAREAKRSLIAENRERRSAEALREALRSLRQADASALPSDQDLDLLHALTASFQHFRDISPPSSPREDSPSLQDLVTPHIKRLIAFANSFPAFTSLPAEDRFRLVRAAWLELLLFATALNAQDGRMRLPSGRIVSLLSAEEDADRDGDRSLEEERLRELGQILSPLELDGTEAGVMGALLLANPEREALTAPLEVESAQDQLLTALARYQPQRQHQILLAAAHFRAVAGLFHHTSPKSQPLLSALLLPPTSP